MAEPTGRPPAWFIPAIFGTALLAVLALVGLGAVLYEREHQPIKIGERSFAFPAENRSSLSLEPHVFVRTKPADAKFELVYDSRIAGQSDRIGVPLIFSVNDGAQTAVRYSRRGRSIIVCRRASSPAGVCGTWISYGGAIWSILFPEGLEQKGDSFARQGLAYLRRSDVGGSGLPL